MGDILCYGMNPDLKIHLTVYDSIMNKRSPISSAFIIQIGFICVYIYIDGKYISKIIDKEVCSQLFIELQCKYFKIILCQRFLINLS